MPNQPQRRANKLVHLDASVEHVERSLLARADELTKKARTEGTGLQDAHHYLWLSDEFRLLAEELHWW